MHIILYNNNKEHENEKVLNFRFIFSPKHYWRKISIQEILKILISKNIIWPAREAQREIENPHT